MKRRIIIVTAAVLAVLVALPVAGVYWVLYTDSGLRFALAQLDHLKNIVRIRVDGVHGNLAGGVLIEHVEVEQELVLIKVDKLSFTIVPRALLLQTWEVQSPHIAAASVQIRHRQHPPTSKTPLKFLPSFLRISARAATLDQALVVLANQHRIDAHALRGSLLLTSHHLTLTQAFAHGGFFTAAGRFELAAADPIGLGADLQWTLEFADRPAWRGQLRAQGDLNDLQVSG